MELDQILVAVLVAAAIAGLVWIERNSRKSAAQPPPAEPEPAPAPARETPLGQGGRRQARR
jgi:hypothetical protein